MTTKLVMAPQTPYGIYHSTKVTPPCTGNAPAPPRSATAKKSQGIRIGSIACERERPGTDFVELIDHHHPPDVQVRQRRCADFGLRASLAGCLELAVILGISVAPGLAMANYNKSPKLGTYPPGFARWYHAWSNGGDVEETRPRRRPDDRAMDRLDPEGNFWNVPRAQEPGRHPFYPSEETELVPVPGHYQHALGLLN